MLIAEYVRDQAVQLEMALLWVDTSPDDPEAHKAALQAYLNQGDALTALTHAIAPMAWKLGIKILQCIGNEKGVILLIAELVEKAKVNFPCF